MMQAKPFTISRYLVHAAYKRVRSNRGSGGVDGISLVECNEGDPVAAWHKPAQLQSVRPLDHRSDTYFKQILTDNRSRMMGDYHVRFWENLRLKCLDLLNNQVLYDGLRVYDQLSWAT